MSDGAVLRYVVTEVHPNVACPDEQPAEPGAQPRSPGVTCRWRCSIAGDCSEGVAWTQPTDHERLTLQTSQGYNRNWGELVVVADPLDRPRPARRRPLRPAAPAAASTSATPSAMVSTSRSTSAASLRDHVFEQVDQLQARARVDAHELGVAERDCTSASRRARIVDQGRQVVDAVLADAGQQRQPHAHAHRARDLQHRARHPVGRCPGRLDRGRRPRRHRQPEAAAEDGQVARQPIAAPVLGAPPGRQPQADGAQRDAEHGRQPLASECADQQAANHRPARDGRRQGGERQGRLIGAQRSAPG